MTVWPPRIAKIYVGVGDGFTFVSSKKQLAATLAPKTEKKQENLRDFVWDFLGQLRESGAS